jgi:hypothetical protein
MRLRMLVGAAVLCGGIGAAVVVGGAASASPTVLVVGTSPSCSGTYPTITAAVAAAVSGDTIKVCAGTYHETVDVDTPDLTFVGAEAGKKGSAARAARLSEESVVSDVNGDFVLGAGADDTTITGFALEGAGSPTVDQDGIEAFAGSSGLHATDDLLVGNGNGIDLQNPEADNPATISYDYIWDNNSEGDLGVNGYTGTGVFVSNGPADDTSITHDVFGDDSQTAINFAGGASPSEGLVVAGDTSLDDSTFVVAVNSVDATIEDNRVIVDGPVPGGDGTGILDFGGNTGLRILKNVLSSDSDDSAAIALSAYDGAASIGTTVAGNTVSGWDDGVSVASGYTTALVSGNRISHDGAFGIAVDAHTSGNVMSQNRVSSDSGTSVDCSDLSTGFLTAGTGNTWLRNVGSDHDPAPPGIC